jgi:8-oxo-dGTP pyrophosphatase MutT (NUDIX family)
VPSSPGLIRRRSIDGAGPLVPKASTLYTLFEMRIDLIRERLSAHRARALEGNGGARAAVALVLRDGEDGAEFVAIRRSQRPGDPWSGHMALPGGRQHASDVDLVTTVARETREEVGIDLVAHGEMLGRLDELRAFSGGQPIISPFVFALAAPVDLTLDAHEVDSALWVPLPFLRQHEAQGSMRFTFAGQEMEYSAFVYRGHTIWGLTYRILINFLSLF